MGQPIAVSAGALVTVKDPDDPAAGSIYLAMPQALRATLSRSFRARLAGVSAAKLKEIHGS